MSRSQVPHSPYDDAVAHLPDLGFALSKIFSSLLDEKPGAVISSMPWRIKSKESADRNMLANPERYSSYASFHDLLGMRIITLFESDIESVEAVVKSVLDIDTDLSGDRLSRHQPNQFGYRSKHYVGKLAEPRVSLPENERFQGCIVEIQLRSILQHAWAEIEHDLGYKPQREVTTSLRRRFSQLAALMELADESFSDLRRELEHVEATALQADKFDDLNESLTVASLQAFIRGDPDFRSFENKLARQLQSSLNPPGPTQREFSGYLLDLLSSIGLTTRHDLASTFAQTKESVLMRAADLDLATRAILEYPKGDGLRPGFGVILLAREMRGLKDVD